MASLRGLYAFAKQQNALGDAIIVDVGLDSNGQPVQRCFVAEDAPNILARAVGEGNVPQIRAICDGYCGLYPKRPTKQCRAIDRRAQPTAVAQPPGVVAITQTRVPTPYRSGAGAAGAGTAVGAPAGFRAFAPAQTGAVRVP